MSRTSIELGPVALPAAVARSQRSIDAAFEYTQPGSDTFSLHSLERTETVVSKSRSAAIISSVTLITAISTLLNGLTTVALPTIASDLDLQDNLLLWSVLRLFSIASTLRKALSAYFWLIFYMQAFLNTSSDMWLYTAVVWLHSRCPWISLHVSHRMHTAGRLYLGLRSFEEQH